MSVADPLVLSPDVSFVSVADLPESVREQLSEEFGDRAGYALTQPRGRKSSIFIDVDAGELLREFTTPSTIVDAVVRYSRQRDLDPERVLVESFPTLRRCLDTGYLVEPGEERAQSAATVYAVGDRVSDGVVLRCLQSLDDSEIYQLALDSGGLAVLKVLRTSRSTAVAATYRREVGVLRHLAGADAPRLLRNGTETENSWMLLEWCEGVPVGTAAAVLRRSSGGSAELLSLCRRVASAYARLHAAGVVQGDAHPGNLVVSPSGTVRVLDFGLARWRGLDPADAEPPRGGVPTYLAPDQASAMLAGRTPAPATESSEQFCLATVLYELFTGHPYLEFAIDERAMLRQIVEDVPLPFTRVGRPSWPDVERPLRAALAKDPADRLVSVAELERRFAAARPLDAPGRSAAAGALVGVDQLLDAVVANARPGGRWFTDGLPTAPLVSVAYGSAGLAVALHHVAVVRDDPELGALADEWALRAAAAAGTSEQAFEDREYDLTETVTGLVTPFHRRSGIYAVQALVSHSLDNAEARQAALNGFVTESLQPCKNIDLVLGRSGTLLGASILHEAVAGSRYADLDGLVTLGTDTLRRIWAELDVLPPIADGTELRHLGVAHGWAGFLLATLRWCRTADVPLPAAVEERLAQLAELALPAGAGLRWPWTNDVTSSMPGWCNGSAGFVHLWTAAHTAFRDDRWVDLAERAAWDAYLTPAIAQLCCGLAGQAYGLLELYRHTGERRWLTAATELAVRAAAEVVAGGADGCVAGSLHKGELGVAVLAADLTRPETASMPFFGSLRS